LTPTLSSLIRTFPSTTGQFIRTGAHLVLLPPRKHRPEIRVRPRYAGEKPDEETARRHSLR
jgi:hypothetical protein